MEKGSDDRVQGGSFGLAGWERKGKGERRRGRGSWGFRVRGAKYQGREMKGKEMEGRKEARTRCRGSTFGAPQNREGEEREARGERRRGQGPWGVSVRGAKMTGKERKVKTESSPES